MGGAHIHLTISDVHTQGENTHHRRLDGCNLAVSIHHSTATAQEHWAWNSQDAHN
jgi:hypothetical protein